MNTQTATPIDNILLDKTQNKNYTIGPYPNGLSDHDALMLSLRILSLNGSKVGKAKIGRKYDGFLVDEFLRNLSYEN
jgi:O-succinylbenzoate synthase